MTAAAAPEPSETLLVADVGNTRLKLAVIAAGTGEPGPLPAIGRRQDFLSREFRGDNLDRWLDAAAPGTALLLVASVHDAAAVRLEAAVAAASATRHRAIRQRRISHADLPLEVVLDEPHRVGIDRLAGAAAAAAVKPKGRAAILVDCGTATTVDLISPAGGFLGGAILPGPGLMAKALAEGTSRLPEVAALERGVPPAMPGRSTQAAIAAGIGWGMRGAVARLVDEGRRAVGHDAVVILTGGSSGLVRDAIPDALVLPDLVLAGIGLAAARCRAR
jgi:type III pantothenate kinase